MVDTTSSEVDTIVLLAMMFVDVALLVFIEEMQNPVYVGDIYVLVGDFVLSVLSILKTYERHNEVSFFTDILYKLWQNGILSTADIYAHGGLEVLNFTHIIYFRSVVNIHAPLKD